MKKIVTGLLIASLGLSISLMADNDSDEVASVSNIDTNYTANIDNGKKIFNSRCIGCHGQKGERKALGQSEVIQNFSEEELISALDGYKNQPADDNMEKLMKSQVQKYSDNELRDVAKYVSTLKDSK